MQQGMSAAVDSVCAVRRGLGLTWCTKYLSRCSKYRSADGLQLARQLRDQTLAGVHTCSEYAARDLRAAMGCAEIHVYFKASTHKFVYLIYTAYTAHHIDPLEPPLD